MRAVKGILRTVHKELCFANNHASEITSEAFFIEGVGDAGNDQGLCKLIMEIRNLFNRYISGSCLEMYIK